MFIICNILGYTQGVILQIFVLRETILLLCEQIYFVDPFTEYDTVSCVTVRFFLRKHPHWFADYHMHFEYLDTYRDFYHALF